MGEDVVTNGEVPERLRWAVERLELHDLPRSGSVIEVGCGHGAAADLLLALRPDVRYLGIDRSASMVKRATARNAEHVRSGQAQFAALALEDLTLDLPFQPPLAGPFDLAFAVDVNAFGARCDRHLERLRAALVPDGRLVLVHRPPVAAKIPVFESNLRSDLPKAGFDIVDVDVGQLSDSEILGVQATRLA